MDKKMQAYETIFVCDPNLGENGVAELIEKFKAVISKNGEITQVNDWGKRRLAYPIKYRTEGYYTLVYFNAPTEFAAELTRLFNINEGILRSIVLREDDKVAHAAAEQKPAEDTGYSDEDDAPVEPAPMQPVEAPVEAEETVEEATEEVTEEEPAKEEE